MLAIYRHVMMRVLFKKLREPWHDHCHNKTYKSAKMVNHAIQINEYRSSFQEAIF